MRVYRLVHAIYAKDLTGEGARLHGGRWNHIGSPCIYASESRSLAVLELSVNVNLQRILRNLSMVEIEIPDDIHEIATSSLPGNWRDAPAPSSTKDFGSRLLQLCEHAVIKIPSSVVPEEFNYLINPLHPLNATCKVVKAADFIYDIRIKTAE